MKRLAALALGAVLVFSPAAPGDQPRIELSAKEAGAGGTLTVTGSGWRGDTLLTLLICGQNMIGGTNSCANADGRAVTTQGDGSFRKTIPVADPPEACPCVVHVATVMGKAATAQVPFVVAGHPVEPLPKRRSGERLGVLAYPRLDGTSGVLNWFGAPAQRRIVITVGNLGSQPAKDPVFEVGTSHGVFAPTWEKRQWRGTIPAGGKAEIELPVELAFGAYGDHRISLRHDGRLLAEQPWGVSRPWGVVVFWVLLGVVVSVGVFRVGMVLVDRLRPRAGEDPERRGFPHRLPRMGR